MAARRSSDREPAGVECLHCGTRYDPVATRWLCPLCRQKTVTCCEGSPQPEEPRGRSAR